MLFSYKWLKEYVKDLPSPKEIADRLTMSGTEVESVRETAGITGVVTAEIVSRDKHPNADRLSLCEVKTGKETFSIVCGADNMKAGDRVALALPGAELPGGFKIKKSKIRGVESGGMMCSEKELGLKESSEGIWILPKDTPLGVDLRVAMGLDDAMLEVSITPNRADLLSVRGLARELAAITGAIFVDKKTGGIENGGAKEKGVTVSIEPGAPCGRYAARVVEGVKIGPSPEFMRLRLEAAGVRSINNVVDVTNYVLLELGQPLHAFDLDKIKDRRITVRLAADKERIETIDNKTRELFSDMLVIADTASPVAVAGVMGGKGSEVSDATVNVLLESAFFEPSAIRRQSRKLGLSSDSSYRFERGVDINGVTGALDMAALMLKEYCGAASIKDAIDVYPKKYEPQVIRLRIERATALLGIGVEKAGVIRMLGSLGMVVKEVAASELEVISPSYRFDVRNETDLIEEIARLSGYDKIPPVMPVVAMAGGDSGVRTLIRRRINSLLVSTGFSEVVNYSFVSPSDFGVTSSPNVSQWPGVRLMNPLSEEQSVMRAMLVPSLLGNLKYNLSQRNDDVSIFEFAPVFLEPGEGSPLPKEEWRIAGLMHGRAVLWNGPKEPLDFYDVKGVVQALFEVVGVAGAVAFRRPDAGYDKVFHPGKSAAVHVDDKFVGVLGRIHPDLNARYDVRGEVFVFELDADALVSASSQAKRYRPLAKFPGSTRDVAFIVSDSVLYADVRGAISGLDTKLIENVELFDVYCGDKIPVGTKSMAIRVAYRSLESTLRQEEVDEAHAKVCQIIVNNFNAVIRAGQ